MKIANFQGRLKKSSTFQDNSQIQAFFKVCGNHVNEMAVFCRQHFQMHMLSFLSNFYSDGPLALARSQFGFRLWLNAVQASNYYLNQQWPSYLVTDAYLCHQVSRS